MLNRMNKGVPAGFLLFSLFIVGGLYPATTIGFPQPHTEITVMSDQLKKKLAKLNNFRHECNKDSLCYAVKLSDKLTHEQSVSILSLPLLISRSLKTQ